MPFTDEPWNSPEADLEAEDFCAVCLIDMNAAGSDKVKGKCKLPIRSKPGAAINKNALHAAAGAHGLMGVSGVPPEEKQKAARKLVRMYSEMDETAPDGMYRMAGMKPPA